MVAVEELDAQFAFQRQNLLTQGGLGNAQLVCHLGEIKRMGQGYGILKLTGIQGKHHLFRNQYGLSLLG